MIINLRLAEVFGAGASQTATTFTIAKSDLPTLTPAADNNGQELLVGILLRLLGLGLMTSPKQIALTSPAGKPLSFPPTQNPLRFQLWRIIPKGVDREIIFTLESWS